MTISILLRPLLVCALALVAECAAAQQQLAPPVTVPSKKATPAPTEPPKKAPAVSSIASKPDVTHTIVVLVNDEPISVGDIDNRFNLVMNGKVTGRLKERLKQPATQQAFKDFIGKRTQGMTQPKSQDEAKQIIANLQREFVAQMHSQERAALKSQSAARNEVLEELITERLKLQEAKKQSVLASDAEVKQIVSSIAQKNKTDEKGFEDLLAKTGVSLETFRDRIRADISWKNVVRKKFGHEVQIGTREIERAIASTADLAVGTQVDLLLHKVTLPVDAKASEQQRVAVLASAEELRKSFKSCERTKSLAAGIQGAKFEDLGRKQADSLVDPAKTLILNTKAGEMTPPTLTGRGVELYAVCAKQERTPVEKRREDAQEELRQQQFEQIARRHLKDLRSEATIEHRK